MTFRNPIVGETSLIREAIQSPDYVPGVTGWTIRKDGTAEFNDLTVRGTFTGTNYTVDPAGIFFYNGTPAAGNMNGSWAPMDGSDPYGNAYTAGLTLYSEAGNVFLGGLDGVIASLGSGGNLITLEDGQISLDYEGSETNAYIIQNLNQERGSLYMQGGLQSGLDQSASVEMVTSTGTPTPGAQDTFPRVAIGQGGQTQPAHLYVSGALVKSSNDTNTGEKWQTPAPAANFAVGSSASTRYQALQYRRDGEDNIIVDGAFHSTSTTSLAAGAYTIFPLTGAYIPKKLHAFMGLHVSSGDVFKSVLRVGVDSSGSVGISTTSAIALGDNFYIYACAPLGNIS